MFFFQSVTKTVTQRKSKRCLQLSRNLIGLFPKMSVSDWILLCTTHWREQRCLDSSRKRQISQSDCEIGSNCGKKCNFSELQIIFLESQLTVSPNWNICKKNNTTQRMIYRHGWWSKRRDSKGERPLLSQMSYETRREKFVCDYDGESRCTRNKGHSKYMTRRTE